MASALQIFGALGAAAPEALTLYQKEEELQRRAQEMRMQEENRKQMLDISRQQLAMQEKSRQDTALTQERQRKKADIEISEMEKAIAERDKIITLETDPRFLKMDEKRQEFFKKYIIDQTGAESTELGTTKVKKGLVDKILDEAKDPKKNRPLYMSLYGGPYQDTLEEYQGLFAKLSDAQKKGDTAKVEKITKDIETMTPYLQKLEAAVEGTLHGLKSEKTERAPTTTDLAIQASNPDPKISGPAKAALSQLSEFEKSKHKPSQPPSMGNAIEAAVVWKFGSTDYLTDPTKRTQAEKWLGTPEGIEYTKKAAETLTPPSVSMVPTAEGIVPFRTRGPGAGSPMEPSGVGKPIPAAEVTKIGDLNAVLRNIEEVEKLYNPKWVGPVMGRVGSTREKYTGGATDEQVQFYSYIRDMQDALLRARSGAQINEQEYNRLTKFLPNENLPDTSFESRLKRFKNEINIVLEEKQKSIRQGGYGSQRTQEKLQEKKRKPLSSFEEQ